MLRSERESRDKRMREADEWARQRERLSSQEDIAEMREEGATRRTRIQAESRLMPAEEPAWAKRRAGYRGPSRAREPIEMAKQRMVGEQGMAGQRLIGEQATRAGELDYRRTLAVERQKALEEANLESIKRGHEMSKLEMELRAKERGARAKGLTDWKSFKEQVPGGMGQERTGFFSPSTGRTMYPGGGEGERGMQARTGEVGGLNFSTVGKPTLSKLWGMDSATQEQYLDWLETNDKKGFMALRNELSMLKSPGGGQRPSDFEEEEEYGPSDLHEQRRQGRGFLYTNY